MKRVWKELTSMEALVLLVALALASPALLIAQSGPLDRSVGTIHSSGLFYEFTAGAATIAANDAVYLTTAGTVLKVPITGQTTTLIGVAPFACAANSTTCIVQIDGKATVVADDAIVVGDYVGAPTTTAGRVLALTGTIDTNLVVGKALTAQATPGGTLTILLLPGKGGTARGNGTSGGIVYYSGTNTVASSGALTANSPVLGGGAGTTPATVAGITSDGASQVRLGVAGTSVGSVRYSNATSGTITQSPVTGALGTIAQTIPAVAGTQMFQLGTTVTLANVDLDTTDNSIAAHVCEDLVLTATGLTATDNIAWIMTTSDLAATFNVQLHTPATDAITARTCNNSAAGADPGAVADFRIVRLMP